MCEDDVWMLQQSTELISYSLYNAAKCARSEELRRLSEVTMSGDVKHI